MAEDAERSLHEMMGFGCGENTVTFHSLNPPLDPVNPGVTDWKVYLDEEGYWCCELSFDSEEAAAAAQAKFEAEGGWLFV